jgi:hypothetical protein
MTDQAIVLRPPREPGWVRPAREEAIEHMASKPKPAITRDRWHRYTYQGVTYPGVTSIVGIVDKSKPLMTWASRLTAEAALEQLDALPGMVAKNGRQGVVRLLTDQSSWRRDEAASIGTAIHAFAERVANGDELGEVPDGIRARVHHYVDWFAASGWRRRLTEALVVNPTAGYGGTLDLLAYDEQGRTVLADVKTGKNVYAETRLQLLAYGEAERIAPQGSLEDYPMPAIDRYVVLHVTESGVEPIELDLGDEDRAALAACIPLARWKAAHEKKWRSAA